MDREGGQGGSALAIQISQAGWTDVKKKERKTTLCSVSEAAVAGSLWARCLAPVQNCKDAPF